MITSRQQNIIQNQKIVIENVSFENVEKFKYLGVTVMNINDIREKIKSRIKGNTCYYSLEKILSPRLLSKKLIVNIKISSTRVQHKVGSRDEMR